MDKQIPCDVCGVNPISGIQLQCSVCPNFVACGDCEDKHDKSHLFLQIHPSSKLLLKKHPKLIDRSHMRHEGYFCELCDNDESIIGFRYHCVMCQIDLCESCEARGLHDYTHPRMKHAMSTKKKDNIKPMVSSQETNDVISTSSSINLSHVTSPFDVPSDVIKAMLKREDILRLSPETQQLYKEYRLAGRGEEGMQVVVDDIQKRVVKEFGLSMEVGIEAIQCAESILEGDDEVKSLSLYRRHNRCIDGNLNIGDIAPNVKLIDLNHQEINLLDMVNVNKPLIIIAGSYT